MYFNSILFFGLSGISAVFPVIRVFPINLGTYTRVSEFYPDLPEPVPHVNGSLVRTGKPQTFAFSIIDQISPH